MEYRWMSLSGREGLGSKASHAGTLVLESPRLHSLTASSMSEDTLVIKATRHLDHSAHIQRHFWTVCTFVLTRVPSLAQGSLIIFFSASACLRLFFVLQQPPFSSPSHLHLLMCHCGPPATRLAEESSSPPRLCPAPPHACHCSALCATLACFVNNHLFVAGIVAAITSDLPVSSIMDRLLDVNICKSLLLNSPPGWD